MPFTAHFDEEKTCIMVAVTGELNLPLLQEMASSISKMITKHGCKRILNDLREAFPAEGAFEIYKMPVRAVSAGINLNCKRGLIVGNKTAEFQFLETVFLNQGHQVKMFTTAEEALEWLLRE